MATTVKEVNAALRKVSTGEDMRQEMEMVVGPHANWEEYLYPAPLTILLLGDLMLVSAEQDFTLAKKQPKDGFQYIRWPDSFRASLSQVSHSGWRAFNTAHKNMDKIRLLTADVPTDMKHVVDTLVKGSPEDIQDLLPIYMGQIQGCSQSCLQLAMGVQKEFEDVMCLAQEILEACVSTKSEYDDQLKDTEVKLTIAKKREEDAERQKRVTQKEYKRLQNAVERAEKSYEKAIDAMPSAWDTVCMQTVEGITNVFTTILSNATSAVTRSSSRTSHVGDSAKEQQKNEDEVLGNVRCYTAGPQIKSMVDNLTALPTGGGTKQEEIIRFARFTLEGIMEDLADINKNLVKSRLMSICQRGITFCKDKQSQLKSMQSPTDQSQNLQADLERLSDDVIAFTATGNVYLNANPTESKPPGQAKMASAGVGGSAVQQAVQNARNKAEVTNQNLETSRDRYEKSAERKEDACAKLLEIMNERGKLDIEKIDFENIRQILIKGIKALGELAEKWQKLVMFFQMMSNIVECCLNKNISSFLQQSQVAEQRLKGGYSLTQLKKDMIYKQAFEASKIAYLVNMISGTYVQVSGMYIMDRIAGLGKLLGFDAVTEKAAIRRERQNLVDGCMEAQEGIKSLIIEKKRNFDTQIQMRLQKLETELLAALPPPTAEEQNALDRTRNAIASGVTELKKEEAAVEDAEDDTASYY